MDPDALVVIYGTANPLDLALCRQVLEEAGIPVVEQRSTIEELRYPPAFLEPQPFRLLVRGQDADYARAMVADYLRRVEAGEYALDDEEGEEA